MSKEVLKLALEALEEPHPGIRTSFTDAVTYRERVKQAITALQEALAQPQQEPVGPKPFGYFQYDIRLDAWVQNRINDKGVAFYTKEKKCTKTKLA